MMRVPILVPLKWYQCRQSISFNNFFFFSTSFNTHHVNGNIRLCKRPPLLPIQMIFTQIHYKCSNYEIFTLVASYRTELTTLSNTPHLTSPPHTTCMGAAIVGQSHIASNWRTLAVIGCEQNHTNSNFFSRSGYKKDRMQVSFDWRSFDTTWYLFQLIP